MKNVEDLYPLSPLQASLLQHHLAAPASGVGFEQSTATLRGAIDADAFELAWCDLVARHPILRTAFLAEGVRQPLQLVRRSVELRVECRDWRRLSPQDQEMRLEELLAADRARGFDVRRAPLLRVALIRRGDDLHQFVWSYHHLLLDGWCRALVMEDLFALYDAAVRGTRVTLTPRRPFRDYIAWLKTRNDTAATEFWCRRLAGLAGATPLPADRSMTADRGERGWVDAFLDAAEVKDLKRFATDRGVTIATLVQAAWALLLARTADLEDVVYGTTVSGRPTALPGSDAMLGMFINNLPVRVAAGTEQRLGPWLTELQTDLLALRQFEHSAPEAIRGAAGVEFERRLFDSLVLVQNYPLGSVGEHLDARSLTVEGFRFRLETAYPLTLVVAPADGLQLRLHYDPRRYGASSARPVVDGLRRLILALPGDPERRLGDLSRQPPVSPRSAAGVLPAPAGAGGSRWLYGERVDAERVAALLAESPAVAQATALFRPAPEGNAASGPHEERLVALVVAEPGSAAGENELLRALRQRLPAAALPSALARVDSLPQGVELAALADRVLAGSLCRTSADPIEEVLGGLWCEVLGLSRIEPRTDFFELGGHSLLAQRLVARVREAFAIDLPLRALFEEPTLAAMGRRVAEARRQGTGAAPGPIPRAPRDGELPLSFAQERLWFMHQLEPESAAYNSPRALLVEGALDIAALGAATTALAARHESLRTRFPSDDEDRPQQVIDPPAEVRLPMVDLTRLPASRRDDEARRGIDRRACQPFDLARGPLFRALLMRLEDCRHAVLFDLHHIVSDGWSMDVLIRELQALYGAAVNSVPPPLAPLRIQVADHAAWQKSAAVEELLADQRHYWRRQLAGLADQTLLPTDRPRGEARGFRGADLLTTLEPAVSRRLATLGRGQGATHFMTLLAVFDLLLHRLTGATDLAVGTDVAGRDRLELEGLIGFFVNNLVLRTDLGGNPSFRDLLGRVRETTLDAFVHQEVPFDRVVKDLGVPRDPARTPLFQVLFVLQNTPRSPATQPGLTLQPIATTSAVSKFDLAVFFAESSDGLLAKWTYDTDLFENSTVRRLAARFEHLARQVVERPDAPLSHFELDAARRGGSRKSAQRLRSLRRRASG